MLSTALVSLKTPHSITAPRFSFSAMELLVLETLTLPHPAPAPAVLTTEASGGQDKQRSSVGSTDCSRPAFLYPCGAENGGREKGRRKRESTLGAGSQILSSVRFHLLPPSPAPTDSGAWGLSLSSPVPRPSLSLILTLLCSLWKLKQVK